MSTTNADGSHTISPEEYRKLTEALGRLSSAVERVEHRAAKRAEGGALMTAAEEETFAEMIEVVGEMRAAWWAFPLWWVSSASAATSFLSR